MLSKEQKDRLTPEELIIAEKWDKEKDERDIIFEEIQAALAANAMEAFHLATDKLGDMQPSHCEHERSIWTRCGACDDLELKLYPEAFDKCSNCDELTRKDELEKGRCMDCGDGED
jgi:hypothetical protein